MFSESFLKNEILGGVNDWKTSARLGGKNSDAVERSCSMVLGLHSTIEYVGNFVCLGFS